MVWPSHTKDPTRNKDKEGKDCRMVSTYHAKLRLLSFEPGSKLLYTQDPNDPNDPKCPHILEDFLYHNLPTRSCETPKARPGKTRGLKTHLDLGKRGTKKPRVPWESVRFPLPIWWDICFFSLSTGMFFWFLELRLKKKPSEFHHFRFFFNLPSG